MEVERAAAVRGPTLWAMSRTDEIADDYASALAAADPITATFAGMGGHDGEVTDLSPDGFARRAELDRRTVAELERVNPGGDREAVAREAMLERLGLELERYDAGITTSDLNLIESPLQHVRQSFDLMATRTEQDWELVASRMAKVPEALAGFRRTLAESSRQGRTAARRQVLACADQCASWTSGAEDFFVALVAGAGAGAGDTGVTGGLDRRLRSVAREASAAVAGFGRFLRDELSASAPETDAVGRERYQLGSRYFLGATVDLEETYAWGWEELDRIEAEMDAVADRIVPGGSVDDAVRALDADPKRRIDGAEAFRAWMQDQADRAVTELSGTHFDIPTDIRRLECRIAPTADGGIYYTGPSEDFSRPGRMWWSVPAGVTSFSTWRELTTVYHEGVPGHHLQVGQAACRGDLLNRWQRSLCWVSGHGEGWALYAERLMDELGYLDDPGAKLGMLDAHAFRAARVVVDIGMHLQLAIPRDRPWCPGERWTPDHGLAFLMAHCRMGEELLRFELDRYLGWPGQAPSYKVGERIWLRAREDARARHGAGFDLREFHRAALDLGSLGLDPLRSALARL